MCLGNKFYKQINSFSDVVVFEVDLIHLLVDKNCYFKQYICFGNKFYKQINSFLDVVVLPSFEVHSIHFLVELKCYFKEHILKGNKSIINNSQIFDFIHLNMFLLIFFLEQVFVTKVNKDITCSN